MRRVYKATDVELGCLIRTEHFFNTQNGQGKPSAVRLRPARGTGGAAEIRFLRSVRGVPRNWGADGGCSQPDKYPASDIAGSGKLTGTGILAGLVDAFVSAHFAIALPFFHTSSADPGTTCREAGSGTS